MKGEGKTYDLRNGVHGRLALFVVCFEPEDERGERLCPERLHGEDQGEQNRLPADQVSENDLCRVRLAFRDAAGARHSLPGDFDVLFCTSESETVRVLSIWRWTLESVGDRR